MAYRFITENQEEFGLRWLLNKFGICPNAYYNYLNQTKAEYTQQKETICKEISNVYHELGGIVGHRAMRVFLPVKELSKAKIPFINI